MLFTFIDVPTDSPINFREISVDFVTEKMTKIIVFRRYNIGRKTCTRCGAQAVITRSATFSTEIQNTSTARNYKQCHVSAEVNCFIIVQRLAQPTRQSSLYIQKKDWKTIVRTTSSYLAIVVLIPTARVDFSINRVVSFLWSHSRENTEISSAPPVETSCSLCWRADVCLIFLFVAF